MNYYIKGSAANADQIKAAFEKLGYDVTGFDICNDNILFFTYKLQTGANVISTTNAHLYTANIIKTHPDYKELELPVESKFKVGDWLVYKNGDTFAGGFKEVQVKTVEEINRYTFTHNTNGSCNFIDRNCRLWTIADAKDGDVLVTTKIRNCPFIYRKTSRNNGLAYYYAGVDGDGNFCEGCLKRTLYHFGLVENVVPATKEQRDLLFAKMKEAGYQWDADKKELRKIHPHYNIGNFHAGMPVLVRTDNVCRWNYSVFSHITGNKDWQFAVCNGISFTQCIPFEDNETLLGTSDMCNERFVNW